MTPHVDFVPRPVLLPTERSRCLLTTARRPCSNGGMATNDLTAAGHRRMANANRRAAKAAAERGDREASRAHIDIAKRHDAKATKIEEAAHKG